MRIALMIGIALISGVIGAYAATVFTPVSADNTPLFTSANPGAVICR